MDLPKNFKIKRVSKYCLITVKGEFAHSTCKDLTGEDFVHLV